MEGQPARRRRSLLRMRHRQRCGDRVSGLPRGRGVTATCLASNQRSPGRHRASAPWSVSLLARISGLHPEGSGSKPLRSAIFDAAPPARTPAFEAGQLGSTPRAASIPILPGKGRLSQGRATMLVMLDGKGHADCDSVGRGSNPQASTNSGVWCNDSTAASNSASVGLIPTTPAIHGLRHTTIAAPDKSRLNILELSRRLKCGADCTNRVHDMGGSR